jgi:hypothetical protein
LANDKPRNALGAVGCCCSSVGVAVTNVQEIALLLCNAIATGFDLFYLVDTLIFGPFAAVEAQRPPL